MFFSALPPVGEVDLGGQKRGGEWERYLVSSDGFKRNAAAKVGTWHLLTREHLPVVVRGSHIILASV